jgi:2-polyprenyl-3-methyl-5-hydroxy-6-metoxy-1,4-benzoquinol methylase
VAAAEELLVRLRDESLVGARTPEAERDLRAHAARCERLVSAVARFLPGAGGQVLEVGFGSGYVATALRWRLGGEVELYAVDHPARALVGSEPLRAFLERHRVGFAAADLTAGPLSAFPGLAFDVVVLSEVIEHLSPTDVPGVLHGLAGRVAEGGVLVLSSPNLQSFHRRVSFALGGGRLFDSPVPLPEADGTFGHLRLYGRAELEELLEGAGLALVHWEYGDWDAEFIGGALLRRAQRLAARAVPALGSGWLAAAAHASESRRS